MPRFVTVLILAALTLLATDLPANGIDVPTSLGRGADVYIQRTYPDSSFGGSPNVIIKNDSGIGDVDRVGYWRFDLASVAGDFNAATLSLTFVGAGASSASKPTYKVYGLVDGHAGEDWDESNCTWNNAPAKDPGSGTTFLAGEATLLGTFSVTAADPPGAVVEFSSAALLALLQADTDELVTLMVVRDHR